MKKGLESIYIIVHFVEFITKLFTFKFEAQVCNSNNHTFSLIITVLVQMQIFKLKKIDFNCLSDKWNYKCAFICKMKYDIYNNFYLFVQYSNFMYCTISIIIYIVTHLKISPILFACFIKCLRLFGKVSNFTFSCTLNVLMP